MEPRGRHGGDHSARPPHRHYRPARGEGEVTYFDDYGMESFERNAVEYIAGERIRLGDVVTIKADGMAYRSRFPDNIIAASA